MQNYNYENLEFTLMEFTVGGGCKIFLAILIISSGSLICNIQCCPRIFFSSFLIDKHSSKFPISIICPSTMLLGIFADASNTTKNYISLFLRILNILFTNFSLPRFHYLRNLSLLH